MIKKLFLIILVGVVYLLYARFVLSPHLYKNFSLIDDGQLIKDGYYLKECLVDFQCKEFKINIIDSLPDVGLSRPTSWLMHGVLYQGKAINAQFQHELRVYGFGVLMLILLLLLSFSVNTNFIGASLGAVIFFVSYSFSENVIRLGPIEPYVVVFLGLFSLLFLNFYRIPKRYQSLSYVIIIFLLIFFLLLKEATIAIIPVLFIFGILFPKAFPKKKLLFLLLISTSVYIVSKFMLRSDSQLAQYANNYSLDPQFILKNAGFFIEKISRSIRPFFKLSILLLPFLLIYKKIKKELISRDLIYWLMISIIFTAVLFPWKYVYDRYLLPSVFSFSIFCAILLSQTIDIVGKYIKNKVSLGRSLDIVVILILINLFFRGAPENIARTINYRNWYSTYIQFELDEVNAIAKYKNDAVYFNAEDTIDNWEITYEIPMHLKYFHGGKPDVFKIGDNPLGGKMIFSGSNLIPAINMDKLKDEYVLLDSKEYSLRQINLNLFHQSFKSRPLQTFLNPPLADEDTKFYWELVKFK